MDTNYLAFPADDYTQSANTLFHFMKESDYLKQNPDGTNKTVCYNWSAFVF